MVTPFWAPAVLDDPVVVVATFVAVVGGAGLDAVANSLADDKEKW